MIPNNRLMFHRARILGRCLAVGVFVMASSAHAQAIANSNPCDWGSYDCTGFVYPNFQAVNTYDITYAGQLPIGVTAQLHDNDKAIISYPGTDINPVQQIRTPDGDCEYILNSSPNSYFVPLNSVTEWTFFKMAAQLNPSLGITLVGCGDPPPVPPGGVQAFCGSADGQIVSSAPSGDTLCSAGTASAVATSTGNCSWTWTCVGSNGQASATCQAPKQSVTTTTSVTGPVNLVVLMDASQSMDTMDALVAQNLQQSLPAFAAAHTNITINVATIVLGGSGYSGASQDRCHYAQVYNGSAAGGASNDYGFANVQSGSFTPLASAITYGGQVLASMPKTADTTSAMLVLTDGAETCGGNLNNAVAAQEANGVKMLAVAFPDASYNPQNFTAFNSFETASSSSGMLNALNNAINIISTGVCTSSVASNP